MINNLLKLIRGRELDMRAVVITALSSYLLQLSGILLRWPLWMIAGVTILPWIPLFATKVLWNSRHYGFMAVYSVLMLVQAGHVGEHVFQMGEYAAYKEDAYVGVVRSIDPKLTPSGYYKVTDAIPSDGNLFIFPTKDPIPGAIPGQTFTLTQPLTAQDGKPISNKVNKTDLTRKGQYVDFTTPSGQRVTGLAVIFPGCQGWSWNGPGCGSAHGVFGELDRELIHFLWDGAILIACIMLFIKFRSNPWTKWALLAAFIHQIEHVYLFGSSLDPTSGYPGKGAWLGLAAQKVDAGLLARDGWLGTVTGLEGAINNFLPNRINIHFIYNTLVFVPMVGAFVYQVSRIYDEWLSKALPNLSREQLIQFSANAQTETFGPAQTIFNQGDAASKFYIITKGQVEIIRADKRGIPRPVAQLAEGAYFGEIGILGRTKRTATAKAVGPVEALTLDEATFRSMVAASGESYRDLDFIVRRRVKQLGAVQGKNLDRKVDDANSLVKSRILQGWLDDIEAKSQLLNWNGLAEPMGADASAPSPVPAFPNAQASIYGPSVQQPPPSGGYAPTVVAPAALPATVSRNVNGAPPYVFGSLKVRNGPSTGQRFEIIAPRVIVGRRSSKVSDVPIYMVDDTRVSREHIELTAMADGMYVADKGSANGSWVNGSQLEGTPVRLNDGDEIRLGTDTVISFHLGR